MEVLSEVEAVAPSPVVTLMAGSGIVGEVVITGEGVTTGAFTTVG